MKWSRNQKNEIDFRRIMFVQIKNVVCILCLSYVFALYGQDVPDWMDADIRAMQYPSSKFLIGYASGNLHVNEDVGRATERIRITAQNNLLENVRINMKSNTMSIFSTENINGQYNEYEKFMNQTSKNSAAEIVGMKTKSYFDKKTKNIHVFVYANRDEVFDYHKKLLQFNLSQAEGLLVSAREMSAQNDKTLARIKCSETLALFEEIDESQTLLIAINGNVSENDIQQERTKRLYNSTLKLQSQLNPKYEVLDNLKNNLSQKFVRIESIMQTSNNLMNDGEKAKARYQCELAQTIMTDIRRIQDSMLITEPTISIEMLEQQRFEKLQNEITLLSAQLAQALMVYFESSEDLFGKQESVITNKLKSKLAINGCSFTNDSSKADFILTIEAETRESSTVNNLVFCYADVNLELYDTHKQKSVYSNNISEKGGSTTKEKAARKAMEKAADVIMDNIVKWIK